MFFAFIGLSALAIGIVYFVFHGSNSTKTMIVDVVGAIDGRTIEIMNDGRKERVILAGIGFPRGDEKSETDCANTVREVVVGRRLYMEVFKDIEGCKYVTLKSSNGDCLNAMMLGKGLARYESTGIGFLGDLISAEAEARSKQLGIWDKNRALFKHISSDVSNNEYIDSFEEIDATND